MKPWREIAVPHKDVLEGTFQQSEFAADITAVRSGQASREYQEAAAFFDRTFITEGMRLLLTQVAQRLAGKGGEPVIQLQTAFGGGKTHTMLAVYHLACREIALSELAGVPELIDRAGLMDVPRARVAVIDGTALSPGQPWRRGEQSISTLWGELGWQLGDEAGYELLREADRTGTSPGKEVLRKLLACHAPCVVLIDELVAYVRQFAEGQILSGGTYDSNLSFVQALTEAAKLVPGAIVIASLPESEIEAGSQRGVAALRALEKTFGRVQALWKPVATEEAFEIVRRRLFEPVRDTSARDAVCRAFAEAYIEEGAKLPTETQEGRYYKRLVGAYPLHPEIFDRLYEDWTTIDGFQRTRGVLKLMAKAIYSLWKDDNKDLMILPGSLPLYDGSSRSELTYYLPGGWDAVIERDIDGERAETTELENKETRFGQLHAARRVARTIFLGSAPSSVVDTAGIRGLDRARILLGCIQPGQLCSVYSDALNRLADRLHYLNSSGDRSQDTTRFWFDTRANLRREMEDRKRRFRDDSDVRDKVADVAFRLVGSGKFFGGVHVFTPHADVPDDPTLRLIMLPLKSWYSREEPRVAVEAVLEYVNSNGTKPRYRGNRLLFLAADHGALVRVADVVRIALAWASIVEDVKDGRLNIDLLQKNQAEKELQAALSVLPRAVRECYRWLLVPSQESLSDRKVEVEAFALSTSAGSLEGEIERICADNELVITAWSPIHLRSKLKELYWKDGRKEVVALEFWEDSLRYIYLPRLKSRDVLSQAIKAGISTRDFFGIAYGRSADGYVGFQFGSGSVQLDDTLLLIEPEAAESIEAAASNLVSSSITSKLPVEANRIETTSGSAIGGGENALSETISSPRPKLFHGTAEISPATAKMRMIEIADEIVNLLASDPNGELRVTIEIAADFPNGAADHIRRAVSENARSLGLKTADWE
ncbi:putative AAA+ superfamily ATPase [Methylobacterium sp. BE186]|uniref:ATP-binding protein n=1 Tax=Methylobacterium sp. BE186 TaxID=2817715 RepID=UPI00285F0E72|nr:DUF499 domain-containing protein [Methylobacterium sp. BE186]MDR7037966.1 putative AAA+ superfamily ATPase [Methylobacterium sp. BE186]